MNDFGGKIPLLALWDSKIVGATLEQAVGHLFFQTGRNPSLHQGASMHQTVRASGGGKDLRSPGVFVALFSAG